MHVKIMINSNSTSNPIKWLIIGVDFVLLNLLLYLFGALHPQTAAWSADLLNTFVVVSNLALVLSEVRFHTVVHERLISSDSILRRVVLLTLTQTLLAYIILTALDRQQPLAWLLFQLGTLYFILTLLLRFVERLVIKSYRQRGRNLRTMTFVGADSELLLLYERLARDPAMGYRALGYYADTELPEAPAELQHLGSMDELMSNLDQPDRLQIGDELYVCLSRRDRDTIRLLSRFCDKNVKRFFYLPVSVDTLKIGLRRELLADMELFTTHESPLMNPVNKIIKRTFDILLSGLFL